MSTWPTVRLGEVTESMKNGIYKPASAYAEDGCACLRMYNIGDGKLVWRDIKRMRLSKNELTEYRLLPGDLLVNRVNSRELVGKTAVIPEGLEPLVFESKNIRLRLVRDKANPKFVNYQLLLNGRRHFSTNAQQVVGMASVNQKQLADFSVVLPSLSVQEEAVAEIEKQFSRLDEAVANLKRVKANLKRYKAAVLKAAVEGKLTEDWRKQHPNVEPASELLERILAERRVNWNGRGKYKEPATPDTSNLPLLPKHWTYASVDSLLIEPMCNGISVKGSMTPPGVPALRLNAMTEAGFDYSKVRYIPIDAALAKELAVKTGDFFVSRGNGSLRLVGRGTVAQIPPCQCVFPDTMIRLRIAFAMGASRWISTIWSSELIRRQIEKKVKTTAGIWKISQPELGSILLPVPPEAEQHRIVAEVECRLSVIEELEAAVQANLTRADRLRQSTLATAFSGRLLSRTE